MGSDVEDSNAAHVRQLLVDRDYEIRALFSTKQKSPMNHIRHQ